jgi:hypothetical protein
MKMPAAQLMLDFPFRLRSFCAASVERVREHLQSRASHKPKSGSNLCLWKPLEPGCGLYFLEAIIL